MKIAMFSTKSYDVTSFDRANRALGHEITYFEPRLLETTVSLAAGFGGVCAFVNDHLNAAVLEQLVAGGTRLIALRSAGFNHVDLEAADALGLTVARVPAYSPHAVAEHAVAMILSLNRKLARAHHRVREGNFSLEGLLGFDMNGKTVGVVGTGKIGRIFVGIVRGFGCRVLAYDPFPHPEVEAIGAYVPLTTLLAESDVVSLHCPLTPETHHLIDADAVERMKPGTMLVNTSRGALVDTLAVIDGLKSGRIGHLGLDVYEEEENLFFQDLSDRVIQDDVFSRLLTFPNVLVTGHQAYFTAEAVTAIAETTLANATAFERGTGTIHRVTADKLA